MSFEPMTNQGAGGARFDLVHLVDGKPSCVVHGAKNKVSPSDRGGLWRCLQADAEGDCRAGCQEAQP